MSSHTTKTAERRSHTSLACLACRKRKVKCNSERPRCSNCRLYDVDCIFGEDKRRLSSAAKLANALSKLEHSSPGRIENDVGDTEKKRTRPRSSIPSDLFASMQLPESLSSQCISAAPANIKSFGSSTLNSPDPGPEFDYWINLTEGPDFFSVAEDLHPGANETDQTMKPSSIGSLEEMSAHQTSCEQASSDTSYINDELAAAAAMASQSPTDTPEDLIRIESGRSHNGLDDSDSLDEVTKQITSRLGRLQLAEDGQLRYYGATSNLHILHNGPYSLSQPNIRTVRTHGSVAISRAGLDWQEDIAFENHLINLFFSWHNPIMYVVDKAVFDRERRVYASGQNTHLYCPSLANAIFAIGAAYAGRTHPAIDGSADEFFAFRTKVFLDIEMDTPTIATAQALLVLSAHECAHTRDSRGWVYSGMAVQLISDLGLHLNFESDFHRSGTSREDDEVAMLRRNLFWAGNTIDTLWSSYSGRPSLMKHFGHSVSNPTPSKTYQWEYYVDEHSKMELPASLDVKSAALVHVYLARLATKMARVAEVLYSGVSGASSKVHAFVFSMAKELSQWEDSLPSSLQIDPSQSEKQIYLPSVLELHMQYHEAIILLHRPFITQTETDPQPDSPSSPPGPPSDARQTCLSSATQICRLLILYRRQYSLRYPHVEVVHIALTASLIHVYHSCLFSGAEGKAAQEHLLTCLQALGEMGQTYKSASRALEVVTALRRNWQTETFLRCGAGGKRGRDVGYHAQGQGGNGSGFVKG